MEDPKRLFQGGIFNIQRDHSVPRKSKQRKRKGSRCDEKQLSIQNGVSGFPQTTGVFSEKTMRGLIPYHSFSGLFGPIGILIHYDTEAVTRRG
jgi:hypothetical protein